MLKYMLDTNIVIYTMKNRPSSVREAFKKHDGQMCISSVTLGELVYGAEKSNAPEKNLADIEGLTARLELMPFDAHAAAHFGQVRAALATHSKFKAFSATLGSDLAISVRIITRNAARKICRARIRAAGVEKKPMPLPAAMFHSRSLVIVSSWASAGASVAETLGVGTACRGLTYWGLRTGGDEKRWA